MISARNPGLTTGMLQLASASRHSTSKPLGIFFGSASKKTEEHPLFRKSKSRFSPAIHASLGSLKASESTGRGPGPDYPGLPAVPIGNRTNTSLASQADSPLLMSEFEGDPGQP